MIIKEMTASFGRLDRAHLKLSEGLNIIHAPNEGGKSTWCAFIRAMLYGIPTRDRDKKGYLAEKNRYLPWSGTPMEGEMTLEWQGRDITLRRFTKGTTPFSGFSAVYTDTQQPVPALTAQNCGEVLLGVGRDVWERSAFIGSSPTLAIDGTPELERRITALFSSGEEDVSFSQTEAKLREWQRRRQHNRSGLIPKLEEELAALEQTLDRMQNANLRLTRSREERAALEEEQRMLEGELHIHQRLARRELNQRYAQAVQEHERIRTRQDELLARQNRFGPLPHRDRLRDAQLQLQRLELQKEELLHQDNLPRPEPAVPPTDPRFTDLDGVQAVRKAQDERTQAESLLAQAREKAGQRRRHVLTGLGFLIGAAIAGLAKGALLLGLFVGTAMSAMFILALLARNKDETTRLQTQAQAILDRWNVTHPQQITDAAELYRQQWEAFTRAQEEHTRTQAQLDARRTALAQTAADLVSFVRTFAPEVSSLSGCSAALTGALELDDSLRECGAQLTLATRRCDDLKSQGAQEFDTLELLHTPERTAAQTQQSLMQVQNALSTLDRQEAMARGELLTLGDRAELEARRDHVLAQLDRRRLEYDALSAALDALRRANEAMQARFAPELNRRAGQILCALTDGRYQALTLDRDFDASAQRADSLLPRSALSLSRGTVDQLYLSVRLAVCQLCLNPDSPSPLVLDDALLTFDDGRMALALDYLNGIGQQVLLFSCQKRESARGIGNNLSLQS
ncbi:MAG: hypothetical protein E7440_04775 [Ruminococcaceae bacterium]|nr:hypothetical protein [Oscillospiraceae bacterium]